jgi:hypothetical protein
VLSRAPVSVRGTDADPGCLVFDATLLQDSGALALTITDGALAITPARARQGDRLWTR